MLVGALYALTGCFVQPDPTLDPLTISNPVVPFGTVEALPTNTPTPQPQATPSPTPDSWTASGENTWEDWSAGSLPTATPRTAATAAPNAQSWQTSTDDYNAGYPVLRLGSMGQDVADLQARLSELGYYASAIDGKFAAGTQSAVTEFQQINGLIADGIAGRSTQDLLYSSAAKPKVVSAVGADEAYVLLKTGSAGLDVRKLQGRLAELGYYAGGVDGLYGETTVSAVKAFQRANGLSADGQAGAQTQKKLYSSSAKYASSPVTTADPNASRTMSIGMSGNDVYAMQQRLIELRYLSGVADGVFGEETQKALIAFQKNNNLTADGEAGASTIKKLSGSCKAATSSAQGSIQNPAALREGDVGDPVYELQQRLFELGYFDGRIDGRFGADTTAAVRSFQSANGLSADGIAGSGTQKKMNSGSAVIGVGAFVSGNVDLPVVDTGSALSTLRKGSSGAEVMVLQQYLKDLGFLRTEPDGQFGSGTERALKLFQEANGLSADGVAGPGTLSILYGGNAVGSVGSAPALQELATVAPTATPNLNVVIQWESEGDDVRMYQERLADLGYLAGKYVTGKFNQPTVDATKAFQTMNNLKVDGAAGPQSLKLIYSENAIDASGTRVGDRY